MDDTTKKFVRWIIYAPVRMAKEIIANIKETKKPPKPKTLFRVAIAFLVITLILQDFWTEIIGLILVIVAWINLEYIRGTWRVNEPTEPKPEESHQSQKDT